MVSPRPVGAEVPSPRSRHHAAALPDVGAAERCATQSQALARALDVAPSIGMRMVDRLEAAGLVEHGAASDRHETRLDLTTDRLRAVRTVTARRRHDLRR